MSGGFSQPLENYGTVRHDRRIVEISLEGEHHSEMYLFFAAEDYVYGLKLRLSRGGPAREDVPFPSVALSPGRDVTYTSDGNDAEVEFIVTFDDAERLPVDDDFFWTALAKSETEENRAVRYHRYDYYPANSTALGPVLDVKERPTQEGSYAYELLVNTTSQKN
ncbi:hypothetical protein BaRGS_00035755 [Batillaria attramentaria]|uniref:Uncharacterized protein n=1 Tax=Batillaria attramentaria TaxID=370345 RepID=A0ABD0JDI9_9CAEN